MIFAIVLSAALLAFILWANISTYGHLRSLTPEERKRELEETRAEMQIW